MPVPSEDNADFPLSFSYVFRGNRIQSLVSCSPFDFVKYDVDLRLALSLALLLVLCAAASPAVAATRWWCYSCHRRCGCCCYLLLLSFLMLLLPMLLLLLFLLPAAASPTWWWWPWRCCSALALLLGCHTVILGPFFQVLARVDNTHRRRGPPATQTNIHLWPTATNAGFA